MVTSRRCFAILALLAILPLSGCVYGVLYSSTAEPLVTNMRQTPAGPAEGHSGTKLFSVPTTAASLSVEWSSRAIADAAKQAGITEIYYADLHTESFLAGIWQERTVQVYGR